MNIIIAGAGKVGSTLTRQLSAEGYDITLVDSDDQVLSSCLERYDVITVHGNCAAMEVLLNAGVKDADLLIAATSADEVNLLCCTTAHALNPRLHTIARIRNPEYSGLSLAINPENQAAMEIARLIKYPGFLRRDVFAKGRTEIVELRIDRSSPLCNVSLLDMANVVRCRVLVCAVLRNGVAQVPNSGSFTLQEGDRVFVTAPTANLTSLLKNLGIITRKARGVILVGGGRISFYLAQRLSAAGIRVQIIERNYARCQELAALLPEVSVIHGDGSELSLLESQGLADADVLVTATGMDEMNMIVSLYGSSRGVPQVITKMGHVENQSIIDSLNLGSVVCPKQLCSNIIVRYVRAMQNQTGAAVSVHAIADGQVEAMEFVVNDSTKNCGVPLKHLKPAAGVLIATITHGSQTQIANGDSVFEKGDTIVVVTSGKRVIRQINDIFV